MNSVPSELKNLKVILAHDWLTGMRGGERVLEYLCKMFPQAPIYTLFYNPDAVSDIINRHPVKTSWLQNIPGILKYYRIFLPFFPSAMENLRVGEPADLVISTSHCVAKGLIAPEGARHLCYCFTPMRYAWVFYDEYFGSNPLKKMILGPMLRRLRQWDATSSARVGHFVTLSRHVQNRIKNFYGCEADVVYPPVDLSFWTPDDDIVAGGHSKNSCGDYDLVVSALVPYKRIDIAVRAYTKLGYPLKIVGTGTESGKLLAIAGENIKFLGHVSDERLLDLYRHCRALIFPGEEDFGIVPVEAQACGKPVVAYAKGGLLETVAKDLTGVFFKEQNEEALLEAVKQCAAWEWDSVIIRKNAEKFSGQNFINGLSAGIRFIMENE
ncbi:MAG: glycosyltransferase [Kiritimatiellia bacterium]|nr:glycosyltransferase [Kiritimatiellia bacterium]